jgi:hypothetical protein
LARGDRLGQKSGTRTIGRHPRRRVPIVANVQLKAVSRMAVLASSQAFGLQLYWFQPCGPVQPSAANSRSKAT